MECIKSQGTVCSGQLREAMTGQQKPTWLTELLWDDERGRYLLPPMPTADYEAITFFANATRDWDYNHKTGDGAFPTPYEREASTDEPREATVTCATVVVELALVLGARATAETTLCSVVNPSELS